MLLGIRFVVQMVNPKIAENEHDAINIPTGTYP